MDSAAPRNTCAVGSVTRLRTFCADCAFVSFAACTFLPRFVRCRCRHAFVHRLTTPHRAPTTLSLRTFALRQLFYAAYRLPVYTPCGCRAYGCRSFTTRYGRLRYPVPAPTLLFVACAFDHARYRHVCRVVPPHIAVARFVWLRCVRTPLLFVAYLAYACVTAFTHRLHTTLRCRALHALPIVWLLRVVVRHHVCCVYDRLRTRLPVALSLRYLHVTGWPYGDRYYARVVAVAGGALLRYVVRCWVCYVVAFVIGACR